MVHIDVNDNGEYDFQPPDVTTDSPGQDADGNVAVTGAEVTVGAVEAAGATIVISGFAFGDPITVAAGTTVTVRNDEGDVSGELRAYYMVDTYPAASGLL